MSLLKELKDKVTHKIPNHLSHIGNDVQHMVKHPAKVAESIKRHGEALKKDICTEIDKAASAGLDEIDKGLLDKIQSFVNAVSSFSNALEKSVFSDLKSDCNYIAGYLTDISKKIGNAAEDIIDRLKKAEQMALYDVSRIVKKIKDYYVFEIADKVSALVHDELEFVLDNLSHLDAIYHEIIDGKNPQTKSSYVEEIQTILTDISDILVKIHQKTEKGGFPFALPVVHVDKIVDLIDFFPKEFVDLLQSESILPLSKLKYIHKILNEIDSSLNDSVQSLADPENYGMKDLKINKDKVKKLIIASSILKTISSIAWSISYIIPLEFEVGEKTNVSADESGAGGLAYAVEGEGQISANEGVGLIGGINIGSVGKFAGLLVSGLDFIAHYLDNIRANITLGAE